MVNSKVSLASSMRSTLLTLQQTQRLFDMTSERLSTNRKVNSALDGPAAYFASQALTTRSSELDTLLESMSQAAQSLMAADKGIEALTTMIQQGKAVINQSLDTNNVASSKQSSISIALNQDLSTIGNIEGTDSFAVRVGEARTLRGTKALTPEQTLATLGFAADSTDKGFSLRLSDGTNVQDVTILVNDTAAGALRSTDSVQTMLDRIVAGFGLDERGLPKVTALLEDGRIILQSTDLDKALTAIEMQGRTDAQDKLGLDPGYVISLQNTPTARPYFQVSSLSVGSSTELLVTDLGMAAGTFDMSIGATTRTFSITTSTTVADLMSSINASFSGMVSASVTAGKIQIVGTDPSLPITFANDTTTLAATFAPDNSDTINVYQLMERLNAIPDLKATLDYEGHLKLSSATGDDLIITDLFNNAASRNGQAASFLGIAGAATNGSATRRTYSQQYATLLDQMNMLVQNNDSGYRGINLINGDSLTVNFNEARTSQLTIEGAVMDTDNLGLKPPQHDWVTREDIQEALTQVDRALSMLEAKASEFAQNLSAVQIRQDFAEEMINILTTGSDQLVLADMNEESANLLALQLRQQLATNSLSLASQSAQSVLKLFG